MIRLNGTYVVPYFFKIKSFKLKTSAILVVFNFQVAIFYFSLCCRKMKRRRVGLAESPVEGSRGAT